MGEWIHFKDVSPGDVFLLDIIKSGHYCLALVVAVVKHGHHVNVTLIRGPGQLGEYYERMWVWSGFLLERMMYARATGLR